MSTGLAQAQQSGYETQVYTGVLGKVIGVYLGRPFECWPKTTLETRWGFIDHYVHKDVGTPLIVADDDISGTFTFVRALEDSGKYAETEEAFFGETWLNYLIEDKAIIWWGGIGCSEHTAYLNLKHGIKAPMSGSCEMNGKTISEQIGAQIFIDGLGMVCPGKPELAATLARRAARVSHDGEAVYAAMAIAAMEAAAFVEKDMEKLLDVGVQVIPQDSLIAQVHRDVRAWCREDGDWQATYRRIDERYGYASYGGGVHVVPNHALIVMALSYAPRDFRQALAIVSSCGWDTDCNAGTVGCISALAVGLDKLCESYDFRCEMADRIKHSTADGTHSVTDCLTEARHLADMGRRLMGWPSRHKSGHWLDFSEQGAAQGFLPEECQPGIELRQMMEDREKQGLRYAFRFAQGGEARVSMPLLLDKVPEAYPKVGTGKIYPGMMMQVKLGTCRAESGEARPSVRMFATCMGTDGKETCIYSPACELESGLTLQLKMEAEPSSIISNLGLQLDCETACEGMLTMDSVDVADGHFHYGIPFLRPVSWEYPGWILTCDAVHPMFSTDAEKMYYIGKSEGKGFAYTGTRWWRDVTLVAHVSLHIGGEAGLITRFQGMRRYLSFEKRGEKLALVRQFYGETVLAECPCQWQWDEVHVMKLESKGTETKAYFDGKLVMQCQEDCLDDGAAGFIFQDALLGIGQVDITGNAQAYLL